MAAAFRRVLFLAVLDSGFHSQVLQGVMRHAHAQPWAVTLGSWAYCDPIQLFDDIAPDGVILSVLHAHWIDYLDRRGIPWINIGYVPEIPNTVCEDITPAMHLAVNHLLECGYRRFAFYGSNGPAYSRNRATAFSARLAQVGYECYDVGSKWQTQTSEWVRSLPKPIAVLAANDGEAFQLVQVCRQMGICVPGQIGVMGIDNSLMALLCEPPLSSIAPPADLIGQRTAQLLDSRMNGAPALQQQVVIPTNGLIVRKSTAPAGTLGDNESDIAQAMRFIHDNARHHIDVSDVLRAVPVSRRWLERHFKNTVGRGISEEIRTARIDQVRQMLLTTDLPLSVIADEMGYGTAANLSMIFRKATGSTPGEFRRCFRAPEIPAPEISAPASYVQ